nr:type II secretion system F family protein [Streptomyces sp. TS71-3]
MLLGALFGAGGVAVVYGLRPPGPALAAILANLGESTSVPAMHLSALEGDHSAWITRLGSRVAPLGRLLGFPTSALRADLRVCETGQEQHLASKVVYGTIGLCTPWAAALLLWVAAGIAGWELPVAVSLALAVSLFFVPDLTLRRRAARRRSEMRHTLSLVLDLMVIALAGGAGLHQAVVQAVAAPHGWAGARLRHALHVAQLTRSSPWAQLGDLGRELAVGDLAELALAVNLAGSEGAKIRGSLAAKARAMRRRRISEADGAAQAATEQMSLPVVGLFAAFLLLIGYPALAHVTYIT